MLMECLAAGRAISLPAANTGMQLVTARAVGAYARVRYQFKTAIGRFEGVEEALTRIGANTYMCDAARKMTAGARPRREVRRWFRPSSSTTSPSVRARPSTTAWT
jgi:acyl-CoA dehydrogenase